tara:strand:+ start:1166 stop:2776 length:1611 start_codon:yes stop_codon:yes gene_type:complete
MNYDYMNHKWQRFQKQTEPRQLRKTARIIEAAEKRDPETWQLPQWVKTEISKRKRNVPPAKGTFRGAGKWLVQQVGKVLDKLVASNYIIGYKLDGSTPKGWRYRVIFDTSADRSELWETVHNEMWNAGYGHAVFSSRRTSLGNNSWIFSEDDRDEGLLELYYKFDTPQRKGNAWENLTAWLFEDNPKKIHLDAQKKLMQNMQITKKHGSTPEDRLKVLETKLETESKWMDLKADAEDALDAIVGWSKVTAYNSSAYVEEIRPAGGQGGKPDLVVKSSTGTEWGISMKLSTSTTDNIFVNNKDFGDGVDVPAWFKNINTNLIENPAGVPWWQTGRILYYQKAREAGLEWPVDSGKVVTYHAAHRTRITPPEWMTYYRPIRGDSRETDPVHRETVEELYTQIRDILIANLEGWINAGNFEDLADLVCDAHYGAGCAEKGIPMYKMSMGSGGTSFTPIPRKQWNQQFANIQYAVLNGVQMPGKVQIPRGWTPDNCKFVWTKGVNVYVQMKPLPVMVINNVKFRDGLTYTTKSGLQIKGR